MKIKIYYNVNSISFFEEYDCEDYSYSSDNYLELEITDYHKILINLRNTWKVEFKEDD